MPAGRRRRTAAATRSFAFDDLGNAVRKISLDLGVAITFHGLTALKSRALEIAPDGSKAGGAPSDPALFAIGVIDYGQGDEGVVLYIKAAYHKDVVRNVGVRSYAIANRDFPPIDGRSILQRIAVRKLPRARI